MNEEKDFLEKEPVGKLLLRLALPTVTAQIINMLYNIVDRMYIGHIPETGAHGSYRSRSLYAIDYDCDGVCSICGIWRRAKGFYLYGKRRPYLCGKDARKLFCHSDLDFHLTNSGPLALEP